MRTALAFSLTLLFAGATTLYSAAPGKPTVIRWIVAHDRGNSPFTEFQKDFGRRIEQKSGGSLKIEFVDTEASDKDLDVAAWRKVLSGGADMSQLSATAAQVNVFDLPFVFRSYEHAEAVFDGALGKKLLSRIGDASGGKVRGFGFTYSGGYRVLVGDKSVTSAGDLKGLRMRRGSSYLADFVQGLGVALVESGPLPKGPIAGIAAGKFDLEETEVNRLALVLKEHPEVFGKTTYVNLTHHRMYVTALIANEKFLAGLTPEQRGLLSNEAAAMAAAERKFSVELEKKNLALLAAKGLKVVAFPEAEVPALEKAGAAVYSKLPDVIKLVGEIRAVKDPSKLAQR